MVKRRKREFFTGEVTEELEGLVDNLEELYHQVMEISSLQIEELSYELRDRCITYLELMKRHIEEVLEELGEMDYFGK